jgi:hypothetical protein
MNDLLRGLDDQRLHADSYLSKEVRVEKAGLSRLIEAHLLHPAIDMLTGRSPEVLQGL